MIAHANVITLLVLALWVPLNAEQAKPPRQAPPKSKSTPKEDCCVLELLNPALPSPTNKTAMTIPRRHVEGNEASSVRVIIYEDLQCPDCAEFRKAMDGILLPRYGTTVAFEHRDFPLPKHAWAKEAALAARYFQALDPTTAVEFRRHVQRRISEVNSHGFRAELSEFCRRKGLDADKALASLTNEANARAVEADFQEGVTAGIRKTPTLIVGDKSFVETIDLAELQRVLDALLRKPSRESKNGKEPLR